MSDKIDIIVLNYSAPGMTANCIQALKKHRDGNDERIVLVDQSSGFDKGIPAALLNPAKDSFIQLDQNYGFARGMNVGIACSRPDADVVLINNDCIVTEGWLEDLKEWIPYGAGILVPMTEMCCCEEIRQHPDPGKLPFELIGEKIPAVCWYILREALDKVGGFDPHYEIGALEDFDYIRMMRGAGYGIYAVPAAFVYHIGSQTSSKMIAADRSFIDRNRAYYNKKWGLL